MVVRDWMRRFDAAEWKILRFGVLTGTWERRFWLILVVVVTEQVWEKELLFT